MHERGNIPVKSSWYRREIDYWLKFVVSQQKMLEKIEMHNKKEAVFFYYRTGWSQDTDSTIYIWPAVLIIFAQLFNFKVNCCVANL